MRLIIPFLMILINSLSLGAQKVDFYPAEVFPSSPRGGMEELSRLVKQCMVYPKEALEQGIEGEVFIQFKVGQGGNVIEQKVGSQSPNILHDEALRIFKRIAWVADPSRSGIAGGFDEVKITFNIKKYEKLAKKRGYRSLPNIGELAENEFEIIDINALDEEPKISNATSVRAFVTKHFKYPSIAIQRNISGRVSLDFVIEPYGKVSNIVIVKSLPGGCDEEAKRLVRMMEWTPGIKDGKSVRTIYRYDLNFVHPGGQIR